MIQRYLFTALTEGIAAINARPAILDALFKDDYGLSDVEVTAIKTHWAAKPPNVIHSYPRTDSVFPLYAVVLADEGEDQTYIGNVAGQVDDDEDPQYGADILSAIWKHTYHVMVVSEHPDVTLYYYEVAKSILLATAWEDENLFEIQVSGQDLAPDPRYLPEHLFVRRLTFGCNREFVRVDIASRFSKAYRVAGIHVDSDDDPEDVGGVKTLVDTYTVGDDDGETEGT